MKLIINGTKSISTPIVFKKIKVITEIIISKGLIKKREITIKIKITKPNIMKKKSAFIETKRIRRISRKMRALKKSINFNQSSFFKNLRRQIAINNKIKKKLKFSDLNILLLFYVNYRKNGYNRDTNNSGDFKSGY